MSLVQAASCPYCAGPLFKESYYFRCPRDHRFTMSVGPAPRPARQNGDRDPSAAGNALVLRVVWHTDRREIGRQHAFRLGEDLEE